jgi:hypothetical protein
MDGLKIDVVDILCIQGIQLRDEFRSTTLHISNAMGPTDVERMRFGQ